MITLEALADAAERLGRPVLAREDDHIIVGISGDEPSETRPLQIDVRQLDGATESHAAIVRFVAGLPWTVASDDIFTVRAAAHECTEYLVVGHFEIDEEGMVLLVHSGVYQNDQPPTDEVLTTIIDAINYEQLHFGDYLEQIIGGKIGLADFADLIANGEEFAQEHDLT